MATYTLIVRVRGTSMVSGGNDRMAKAVRSGLKLTLEREKDNIHDEFAVAVKLGGKRIGYVQKERSENVSMILSGPDTILECFAVPSWHCKIVYSRAHLVDLPEFEADGWLANLVFGGRDRYGSID